MRYSYEMVCPNCSKHWRHYRDEPYKKQRKNKLCKECKKKDKEEIFSGVVDLGGLQQEQSCGNCQNFVPLVGNKWWGACELGHCSDSQEPENYEETYDLVYLLDWCEDYDGND